MDRSGADLDQPLAQAGFGLDQGQAFLGACGQRLFAKNRLAPGEAGEHEIRVGFVRRGDEHRIDLGVIDERDALAERPAGAVGGGGGFGPRRIGIEDADQMRTCDLCSEDARMVAAHHACTQDTYSATQVRFLRPAGHVI